MSLTRRTPLAALLLLIALQPAALLLPSAGLRAPASPGLAARRALLPRCAAASDEGDSEAADAEGDSSGDAAESEAAPPADKAEKAARKKEKQELQAKISSLESQLFDARGKLNAAQDAVKDAGENGFKLLAANFERSREQARVELKSQSLYGRVAAARPLVGFVETFDQLQGDAKQDGKEAEAVHKYYGGIHKQIGKLWSGWKVKRFQAKPKEKFDVMKHRMVASRESDKVAQGVVIEGESEGWMMGKEVLTTAGCVVSSGPPVEEEEEEESDEGDEEAGDEEAG